MARHCTCCVHPERDSIDAALVCGDSVRTIGARFGVSRDAVYRHSRNHLSAALAGMKTAEQAERRATLLDRIETLIERAETLYGAASGEGKAAQALNVLRELRGLLELYGKASGELATTPSVSINLMQAPEWLEVRAVIFAALATYPEARALVSGRLLELEAGE